MAPLDTCGPRDGGPAAPPLVGPAYQLYDNIIDTVSAAKARKFFPWN